MNNDIKAKIIKSVTDNKIALKDLAPKLFMTEKQLRVLLESWGVNLSKKRKYPKIPRPDRNTLMRMYHKEGSIEKVAEFYKIGGNTVYKWMRELNIPTRRMKLNRKDKVKLLEKHLSKLGNVDL